MGWWNGAPEPEAPRYIDLDSVATPNFKKIKDITHDDFQKLQKITNALTGHEYVKTKNGEYVYRKIDETPEQKEEREAIMNTYNTTMREFGDRVRNFLKETGSLSSGLRSQIQAIQDFNGAFNVDNLKNSGMQEVASSIGEFSSNMDQIRNYIEGRVNDYYDQAQRALDDKLGAEGKDSSIGMWQQAQLDNERRKAMMDNEFYWLTEGRAKLAQAELLETEAKYRPFMYQQQMLENANNNYLILQAERFLASVLRQETMDSLEDRVAITNLRAVQSVIEQACKELSPHIDRIFLAGSLAKETAVKGSSDYDFFISIKNSYTKSMCEIFNDLHDCLAIFCGHEAVRKQNVSIGLTLGDLSIDIVPGKQQNEYSDDHTIWKNKTQSWTKTNVQKQIDNVRRSGCAPYIRLIKVWRNCWGLDFPSINLELSVLDTLGTNKNISLRKAFGLILQYLSERFGNTALRDIGNQSNVVSDDMDNKEKLLVISCAKKCLQYLKTNQLNSCFNNCFY